MTAATPMAYDSTRSRHDLTHPIVSRDQWLAERQELLSPREGAHPSRRPDRRERRALPWVRLEQEYVFDTPDGRRPLADLFDGRHQLVMQHFMLAPGWEQGCKSCSYMADHTDPTLVHLAQRDTAFIAVSRAPLAEIERFRQRMGWTFPWVSSHGTGFNRDFHVSFAPDEIANGTADYDYGSMSPGEEMPGVSVFWKDDAGTVFHTYSTYGRGVEVMMCTPTTCSTSPPRAATRTRCGSPWTGCAITTATSRPRGEDGRQVVLRGMSMSCHPDGTETRSGPRGAASANPTGAWPSVCRWRPRRLPQPCRSITRKTGRPLLCSVVRRGRFSRFRQ